MVAQSSGKSEIDKNNLSLIEVPSVSYFLKTEDRVDVRLNLMAKEWERASATTLC